MMCYKEKAYGFLKDCGMDYRDIDIDGLCRVFIDEMEKGLSGEKSTLGMIPSYIGAGSHIPAGKSVIAIDAGGTNLRIAAVVFDESGNADVREFRSYEMPGIGHEISREEFFDYIASRLAGISGSSDRIGFCFSYPVEILPDKEGRLIRFSKQVMVRDSEGILIGRNLGQALERKGIQGHKRIVILNDTVAALLGGMAAFPQRRFDSFIGLILGTGTNTCYIEERLNMIINMESGNFGRLEQGLIDRELDLATIDPGRFIFEKMISGKYWGDLVMRTAKAAAARGCLSGHFAAKSASVAQLASKDVDDFLFYPYGENPLAQCCSRDGDHDAQFLYHMIDNLTERAARLIAANLSAIIIKTGKGKDPCKPVCIAAEGSTFYKSKLFRSKLDYYIRTYLNDIHNRYCEFVKPDNPTITGTAIAGLLD